MVKYKDESKDQSIDDLMWEEDREIENELMQQQTRYYASCADINEAILKALSTMTNEEVKDVITKNFRVPVVRIHN